MPAGRIRFASEVAVAALATDQPSSFLDQVLLRPLKVLTSSLKLCPWPEAEVGVAASLS